MLSRLATRQRLLVAAPKMCRLTLVARAITPTQMVQKRQLSVVQWLRGEPLLEQGKFFCKKGKRWIINFFIIYLTLTLSGFEIFRLFPTSFIKFLW